MWSHAQLAWWWYLELRRDRDHLICIMRYEPNLVLGWVVVELTSIQSFEVDLWIYIGTTSIFEKGEWLIAVTCITQTIAVIIIIDANCIIIIVMHIIITLKNGALIVDCCRMMMSKIMFASIGEWGVGQTHHCAAKSMRNFMHCGAVMTEGIHFDTWFEHQLLCPLLQSILNMYLHTSQKCWEQQLDDLDNKQDVQEAIAIKWMNQSKWPKYYSSHYCINPIKQYYCLAKIQITFYCNMANQRMFARYVLYHHKNDNWSLMLFVYIYCFANLIYEYICVIHKNNTVKV